MFQPGNDWIFPFWGGMILIVPVFVRVVAHFGVVSHLICVFETVEKDVCFDKTCKASIVIPIFI